MKFRPKKRISLFGGLLNLNISKSGISTSSKVAGVNTNHKTGKVTTGTGYGTLELKGANKKPAKASESTDVKNVTIQVAGDTMELLKKLTGESTNKGAISEIVRDYIKDKMS